MHFFYSVFFLGLSFAADSKCTNPNIKTISVPLTLESSSPLIPLRFEYHPPSSPLVPTVVFLPGGPGGTSIGKERPAMPPEYGFINTDPRSVGCNEVTERQLFPDSALSTKLLANDVAQIIQSLGLTNYILYGQSYGTLLATVSAKNIELLSLPRPKFLVLEGVLGKAFESLDEMNSEFVRQWSFVKEKMPEQIRSEIVRNHFPFDLTSQEMGRSLQKLFMIGSQQGAYLPEQIFSLAFSPVVTAKEVAKTIFDQTKNPSLKNEAAERLYRLIACQEIAPGNNDDMALENGVLISSKPALCGNLSFGSDKFDSRNYQIEEPIFYFNGDRDPATPLSQMRHHFDSQSTGPKVAVIVPGAGHIPLKFSLSSCMPSIWNTLSTDPSAITKLAEPCVKDVIVEMKN